MPVVSVAVSFTIIDLGRGINGGRGKLNTHSHVFQSKHVTQVFVSTCTSSYVLHALGLVRDHIAPDQGTEDELLC